MLRLGAALDSRLWVADGGVRGREVDPDTLLFGIRVLEVFKDMALSYNELKLSMSA